MRLLLFPGVDGLLPPPLRCSPPPRVPLNSSRLASGSRRKGRRVGRRVCNTSRQTRSDEPGNELYLSSDDRSAEWLPAPGGGSDRNEAEVTRDDREPAGVVGMRSAFTGGH
ncbi:unnamed protein product [Pleuronectes platessa]|uniref:Uncharacterized protein n=1 Tax=Pleuronectes platessa TaxID=8262 RepID=A0A9N7YPN2_PLEPL|nr:unnamed protein product [Pleuronectes platessa]